MTSDHPGVNGFIGNWVRSSAVGWILGLAAVVALALLGEFFNSLGQSDSQLIVGVGMGWGVGLMQSRRLHPWLRRPIHWTVASTVGMGALFVARDITVAIGYDFPYSLPLYVLVGGLLTGLWQGALLRRVSTRAIWWVAGCLLGWAVPGVCVALADLTGQTESPVLVVIGALASASAIFLGGGMLGIGSGWILRWILRRPVF